MPRGDDYIDEVADKFARGAINTGAAVVGAGIALGVRALIGASQTAGKVSPEEMERRLRANRVVQDGKIIQSVECRNCHQEVGTDSIICDWCGDDIQRQIDAQFAVERARKNLVDKHKDELVLVGFFTGVSLLILIYLVFRSFVYKNVFYQGVLLLLGLTILLSVLFVDFYIRLAKSSAGKWDEKKDTWNNLKERLLSDSGRKGVSLAIILVFIIVSLAGIAGNYVQSPLNEPTSLDWLVQDTSLFTERKLNRLTNSRWFEPVSSLSEVDKAKYRQTSGLSGDLILIYHYLNALLQGDCGAATSFRDPLSTSCPNRSYQINRVDNVRYTTSHIICPYKDYPRTVVVEGEIVVDDRTYNEVKMTMCSYGTQRQLLIVGSQCEPLELCK